MFVCVCVFCHGHSSAVGAVMLASDVADFSVWQATLSQHFAFQLPQKLLRLGELVRKLINSV